MNDKFPWSVRLRLASSSTWALGLQERGDGACCVLGNEWPPFRLFIDHFNGGYTVDTMPAMPVVGSESVDATLFNHNNEHVQSQEVR